MSGFKVEIDRRSGFCFGVVKAIRSAENELSGDEKLYCLGDIVHNSLEVERLEKLGLSTINHNDFAKLQNRKVLLRAHGEPPSTYRMAEKNKIEVIDATCPVVLRLQQKINDCYRRGGLLSQIVIYGKEGHAEVNGLVGQTDGTAIVVESVNDLNRINFSHDISFFSQTTMSREEFIAMVETIRNRLAEGASFAWYDTTCNQVASRMPDIKQFAAEHDVVYFVAGSKSSNGRVLFDECRKANAGSFFISHPDEVPDPLPAGANNIGVCGATSTPKWLMEKVAERIKAIHLSQKEAAGAGFALRCCEIFERATAGYHVADSVDAQVDNPFPKDSVDNLLYLKNHIDAVQWHLEDIIRKPDINPVEALAIKRRIDRSNQDRTDTVERLDDYFLNRYSGVELQPGAGVNTESPAWAVDRLSILVLKIYHMTIESLRPDAAPAHQAACSAKLGTLLSQKDDLCRAIDILISDISQGRKYMKTYKQMKMYNDPSLNPVLYSKSNG
jgi:4-hydroxy-3-methylbut-2-enyl diphosphate reductase